MIATDLFALLCVNLLRPRAVGFCGDETFELVN